MANDVAPQTGGCMKAATKPLRVSDKSLADADAQAQNGRLAQGADSRLVIWIAVSQARGAWRCDWDMWRMHTKEFPFQVCTLIDCRSIRTAKATEGVAEVVLPDE